MALFPGLPGWAGTRKEKPIWILLKQDTVSGSGISSAVCKSAPRSRQIATPAPHHSSFLPAGCPSCRPTNSVKALKGWHYQLWINSSTCHDQLSIKPRVACLVMWSSDWRLTKQQTNQLSCMSAGMLGLVSCAIAEWTLFFCISMFERLLHRL